MSEVEQHAKLIHHALAQAGVVPQVGEWCETGACEVCSPIAVTLRGVLMKANRVVETKSRFIAALEAEIELLHGVRTVEVEVDVPEAQLLAFAVMPHES